MTVNMFTVLLDVPPYSFVNMSTFIQSISICVPDDM